MTREQNLASDRAGDHGSLLVLAVLALIVGAVSGLVGALFLPLLEWADRFRDSGAAAWPQAARAQQPTMPVW
jgi:CIC family chloride channel protein